MAGLQYVLTIPGRLPGMNEYTEKNRRNPFEGAKLKKKSQEIVEAAIIEQMRGLSITSKVEIHYHWHEPNRKRDLDNITGFGHKVIQDALVNQEVLIDDGWDEIVGYTDWFYVDKDNPHINVFITEVE